MNDKQVRILASAGLAVGGILGMAGTFAPSAALRGLAWGIDGVALVVATALLTVHCFRQGQDLVASGFLVFAVGEGLILSGAAMDLAASVPSFGAGASLWAAALALISSPRVFPGLVRVLGLLASTLFAATAVQIIAMHRWNMLPILLLVVTLGGSTGCSTDTRALAQPQPATLDTLNVRLIEQIVGREGTEQDGRYKITVPQNDLDVSVDDLRIIPPMGMGSWIAFTPAAEGAVVMGDVVVREDEIGPVQRVVLEHGLTMTGLHNHFVREEPSVMYMHVGGTGSEEDLARGVRAIFDEVTELRDGDPAGAQAQTVQNTLDTDEIVRILGHEGEMSQGVYKITIGRPDVSLRAHGVSVTTFMGFNTWAAWQGTPERAAVAGDFTMLEDEVAPVIEALVENGIEVVAVHNHMIHEEPRIFFLHYWGVGPAEQLARGLKAALDQAGG